MKLKVRLRLICFNDLFCLHGNADQAHNKVPSKGSNLVCSQSKTQPRRTVCSYQSLATWYCKIPTPACGSQEFYCSDRELKHQERKLVFRLIVHKNGGRCS